MDNQTLDQSNGATRQAREQRRALALTARHVNASVPQPISEDTLLHALRTGTIPQGFEHHMFAVLDETGTATLADLVIAGAVTYGQLAALSDRLLPAGHDTREWLDERRGY